MVGRTVEMLSGFLLVRITVSNNGFWVFEYLSEKYFGNMV